MSQKEVKQAFTNPAQSAVKNRFEWSGNHCKDGRQDYWSEHPWLKRCIFACFFVLWIRLFLCCFFANVTAHNVKNRTVSVLFVFLLKIENYCFSFVFCRVISSWKCSSEDGNIWCRFWNQMTQKRSGSNPAGISRNEPPFGGYAMTLEALWHKSLNLRRHKFGVKTIQMRNTENCRVVWWCHFSHWRDAFGSNLQSASLEKKTPSGWRRQWPRKLDQIRPLTITCWELSRFESVRPRDNMRWILHVAPKWGRLWPPDEIMEKPMGHSPDQNRCQRSQPPGLGRSLSDLLNLWTLQTSICCAFHCVVNTDGSRSIRTNNPIKIFQIKHVESHCGDWCCFCRTSNYPGIWFGLSILRGRYLYISTLSTKALFYRVTADLAEEAFSSKKRNCTEWTRSSGFIDTWRNQYHVTSRDASADQYPLHARITSRIVTTLTFVLQTQTHRVENFLCGKITHTCRSLHSFSPFVNNLTRISGSKICVVVAVFLVTTPMVGFWPLPKAQFQYHTGQITFGCKRGHTLKSQSPPPHHLISKPN